MVTMATGDSSAGAVGRPLSLKHWSRSVDKESDDWLPLGGGAVTPPSVSSPVFVRFIFFL